MSAYRLNLLRMRAATAHRKLAGLLQDIEERYGSCNLRDDAAEAEHRARVLVDRLDAVQGNTDSP